MIYGACIHRTCVSADRDGAFANEPLRVAVVTDGLYPFFTGGKEVRLYELIRRAVNPKLMIEVHTMRWWGSGQSEMVSAWRGIKLHGLCRPWAMYVGTRRSIWQAVMFALCTLRVGASKVDLIDVDHMPYLQIFTLRLVSWTRGIPLVVTWHEWWGRTYWTEYLGRIGVLASVLERLAARCADHLIVNSQQTYERLRREGIPAQRMSLLSLGADIEVISEVDPAPEQWDVMYAGRLLDHKRVDVLVEALSLARDRGQDLSCLIVGSGPEEDRLRLQARHLGLDGIVFADTKNEQRELWSLMKSSKIFAYPSVREGFGLAILEAQACGATVITTNHPDNYGRYLIANGVTGYVCDTTAGGLADALQLALDCPADPEALKAHTQGFSWDPRAEQLREIYSTQVMARHAT